MLKAKNKLGLVFFPAYDWAISPTHPEREERLLYTGDQLFEEGIEDVEGIGKRHSILIIADLDSHTGFQWVIVLSGNDSIDMY